MLKSSSQLEIKYEHEHFSVYFTSNDKIQGRPHPSCGNYILLLKTKQNVCVDVHVYVSEKKKEIKRGGKRKREGVR